MKRYLPFLLIAVVFAAALGFGALFFRSVSDRADSSASSTPSPGNSGPNASAAVAATAKPGNPGTPVETATPSPAAPATTRYAAGKPGATPPHVRGSRTAPVTLEEFGDFQCLPCSALYPVLKQLESDYGDRLSVTFREFPLPIHEHAVAAARAAEAAGLQNRFWEMHDALYENRDTWTTAIYPIQYFTDYARNLGLDVDKLKRDMESDEVRGRMAADSERGTSLGIDRTPVLFVNGQRVPKSAKTLEGLHVIVDGALGPLAP